MHVAVINGDAEVPAEVFGEVAHGDRLPSLGAPGGEGAPGGGAAGDGAAGGDGSAREHAALCHITFDDVAAGRHATAHLAGLGHRSFVHLRGPLVRSSLLRLLGYRQALAEAGLWPQPVLAAGLGRSWPSREAAVASVPAHGQAAGRDGRLRRPGRGRRAACGASGGLAGAGGPVVVGIDDIQFAAYTNPGLTTVAQPKHELGALAVDAVLAGRSGARSRSPRLLGGQLVIRESTAQRVAARRGGPADDSGHAGHRAGAGRRRGAADPACAQRPCAACAATRCRSSRSACWCCSSSPPIAGGPLAAALTGHGPDAQFANALAANSQPIGVMQHTYLANGTTHNPHGSLFVLGADAARPRHCWSGSCTAPGSRCWSPRRRPRSRWSSASRSACWPATWAAGSTRW